MDDKAPTPVWASFRFSGLTKSMLWIAPSFIDTSDGLLLADAAFGDRLLSAWSSHSASTKSGWFAPVDFEVCQNPFVFRESEKTGVLKTLLGEAVYPLQIPGRWVALRTRAGSNFINE